MGNCGTTYSGLSGKTKEDFGHGNARFVPYTNVFDNPLTDTERLEAVEIDSSQNKVAYGDVFFTVSSETPDEVGMSSVWLSDQDDVYLNSFCFGYRQDSTFDPHYLAYMLRSSSIRSDLALLAQGISRFNISKNKVMELSVAFPSAVEQKQIGQYFARLDSLITLHQRKCQYRGLYGYLSWEQRKLGEFNKKITTKNADGGLSETFTNSAEQGVISQLDYFDHDITNDANISGYYVVQPDNFVYNPRISVTAPCGPINRNRLNRAGVMSPLYTVFSVDESVDKTYLEHYFKTSRWHDFMFLEGNSGARSDRFSISDATFFEMPIWCPKIPEQRAIAKQLETMDSLITLHQ